MGGADRLLNDESWQSTYEKHRKKLWQTHKSNSPTGKGGSERTFYPDRTQSRVAAEKEAIAKAQRLQKKLKTIETRHSLTGKEIMQHCQRMDEITKHKKYYARQQRMKRDQWQQSLLNKNKLHIEKIHSMGSPLDRNRMADDYQSHEKVVKQISRFERSNRNRVLWKSDKCKPLPVTKFLEDSELALRDREIPLDRPQPKAKSKRRTDNDSVSPERDGKTVNSVSTTGTRSRKPVQRPHSEASEIPSEKERIERDSSGRRSVPPAQQRSQSSPSPSPSPAPAGSPAARSPAARSPYMGSPNLKKIGDYENNNLYHKLREEEERFLQEMMEEIHEEEEEARKMALRETLLRDMERKKKDDERKKAAEARKKSKSPSRSRSRSPSKQVQQQQLPDSLSGSEKEDQKINSSAGGSTIQSRRSSRARSIVISQPDELKRSSTVGNVFEEVGMASPASSDNRRLSVVSPFRQVANSKNPRSLPGSPTKSRSSISMSVSIEEDSPNMEDPEPTPSPVPEPKPKKPKRKKTRKKREVKTSSALPPLWDPLSDSEGEPKKKDVAEEKKQTKEKQKKKAASRTTIHSSNNPEDAIANLDLSDLTNFRSSWRWGKPVFGGGPGQQPVRMSRAEEKKLARHHHHAVQYHLEGNVDWSEVSVDILDVKDDQLHASHVHHSPEAT